MRNVLLALVVICLVAVLPHLLPDGDDGAPKPSEPPTSSAYAADGTFVGATPPTIRPGDLILVLPDTVRRDAVGLGDEPGRRMPNYR